MFKNKNKDISSWHNINEYEPLTDKNGECHRRCCVRFEDGIFDLAYYSKKGWSYTNSFKNDEIIEWPIITHWKYID